MLEAVKDVTIAVPLTFAFALALGVIFSTKIKDFFKGVPPDVRTALNNVETDALAKVAAAKATVIAQLPGAPSKVAAPAAAPLAPAAPAAAAPAAAAPAAPAAQ